MERQEWEAVEARLLRLERRVRLVGAGWIATVVVAALLGVGVQQATSQPQVLRVRGLGVVDTAGRERITLGVGSDGVPAVRFNDAAGRQRLRLAVLPDGSPGIRFYDAAGRERVELIVTSDGSPGIGLYDATGKAAVGLYMNSNGSPTIGLFDANRERVALTVNRGLAGIDLRDAFGRPRITLVVLPIGWPEIALSDAAERSRIELNLLQDRSPEIKLWDASGRALFTAP
jgi:hypothetical protein